MAALALSGEHVSALPSALSPWFRTRCQDVPVQGAFAVLDLLATGATVPFIARYRRERTGNLDEAAVRRVAEAREQFDRLVNRQSIALESIGRHATLTPELRERILNTFDPQVLEDLCLPYKQKKKSRADAARLAGLGPLADWLWNCGHGTETPQEGQTLELWAYTFRAADKGVPDTRTAIEGARDILVERLAEDAGLRSLARLAYGENGWLRATKTEKARSGSRFEPYFAFQEKVSALQEPSRSHRYLAVRCGQSEGELLLAVVGSPEDPEFEARLVSAFEAAAVSVPDSPGDEALRQAARIAFKGVVRSAMENEVHRALKETGDSTAARDHAAHAHRLLLEPPFGPRPVLGIEASARAGGRFAVVDAAGACVASGAIPSQTDEEKLAAREVVLSLVREHSLAAVAIGSGAGGRSAELLIRPALQEAGLDVLVTLVSETGAKAWATGENGRAELADLDPGAREAAFLARRLQDPLRELVRNEPRHILGRQHGHDVAAGPLLKALTATVDSCIHKVGLDVNTSPPHLLCRISGIDATIASAIVERRETEGAFQSRQQLLDVPGLDEKAFEQAAAFLQVPGGAHPLDATPIHPERYRSLESFAQAKGKTVGDLLGPGAVLVREAPELEAELGRWTREDIVRDLEAAPHADPRGPFVPFSFRENLRTMEDLKPGMVCPGLVTSVTTFGAFVDVGLPHDGLVHVSQLGRGVGKDSGEKIRMGDRVQARVLKVDTEKRQISLTLKPEPRRRPPAPRKPARPEARPKAAGGGRRAERSDGQGRKKKTPRPRPAPASGHRPAPKLPRESRPAFNNPFAVLADLKVPRRGKS